MASTKLDKIHDAMIERNIAVPEVGFNSEDAMFISIAEYEAVTGQKFPYPQEEYERHRS